jgi:hypothetical protein
MSEPSTPGDHRPSTNRASPAYIGLDLNWSGYAGTIVEVRPASVLLQLLAGPAIEVPAGEVVTIAGRTRRLIV